MKGAPSECVRQWRLRRGCMGAEGRCQQRGYIKWIGGSRSGAGFALRDSSGQSVSSSRIKDGHGKESGRDPTHSVSVGGGAACRTSTGWSWHELDRAQTGFAASRIKGVAVESSQFSEPRGNPELGFRCWEGIYSKGFAPCTTVQVFLQRARLRAWRIRGRRGGCRGGFVDVVGVCTGGGDLRRQTRGGFVRGRGIGGKPTWGAPGRQIRESNDMLRRERGERRKYRKETVGSGEETKSTQRGFHSVPRRKNLTWDRRAMAPHSNADSEGGKKRFSLRATSVCPRKGLTWAHRAITVHTPRQMFQGERREPEWRGAHDKRGGTKVRAETTAESSPPINHGREGFRISAFRV